jgi:hypothetical protein
MVYSIPNVSNSWVFLGSLNPTSQNGNVCVIEYISNNYYGW